MDLDNSIGLKLSEIGIVNLSWISAVCSFLIGTVIFGTYYIYENLGIAVFGFLFLIMALLINGYLLLINILNLNHSQKTKNSYLSAIVVLILNIPIAISFFLIALEIVMRRVAID